MRIWPGSFPPGHTPSQRRGERRNPFRIGKEFFYGSHSSAKNGLAPPALVPHRGGRSRAPARRPVPRTGGNLQPAHRAFHHPGGGRADLPLARARRAAFRIRRQTVQPNRPDRPGSSGCRRARSRKRCWRKRKPRRKLGRWPPKPSGTCNPARRRKTKPRRKKPSPRGWERRIWR